MPTEGGSTLILGVFFDTGDIFKFIMAWGHHNLARLNDQLAV